MEVKPGFKQTNVGVIPEDWQTSKVGDVCGCIVPGRNKPQLFDGDIPWITTPDLENGRLVSTSRLGLCISKEEAKTVGSKIVPPGSVLMSCAGELGIVAMTKNEIVVNQQLHVFIPTDCIDAVFLLSALAYRKDQIENAGTKTAVPYLNKSACNSILVPLPPPPEQRAIAEALSDVDRLLGGLDRLIAKKRDIKQAAMQQLLTGQTRLPGFHGKWTVKRLGDAFTITAGKSKSAYVAENGDFWVCDMGSVSIEGRLLGSKRTNYRGDFLKRGDLIMPKDDIGGGNIIGKVGYIDANDTYILGDHVYCLRALNGDPGFLAYVINSHRVNSELRKKVIGSAQLGLGRKSVNEQEIQFPPHAEQTAIAEALAEMDAELSALEQRRKKTCALKHAMMQELLTGRTRLVSLRESHA